MNIHKNRGSITHIKGTPLNERITILDVLRGFALFGVLLVNATMINATFMKYQSHLLNNPWLATTTVDLLTNLFVQIFGQGKFYTLFSFLFGLGFYLFTESNRKKGLPAEKLFFRRLCILLLMGVLHFALVWYGDILHVYAIVGFFLFAFEKRSDESIKKWAIGLLIFYVVSITGVIAIGESSSITAIETSVSNANTYSHQIYLGNNYLDLIQYRMTAEFPQMLVNLVFICPRILGMFLLGYYVGRKKFAQDITRAKKLLRRLFYFTTPIAVITTLGYMLIQSDTLDIFGVFNSTMTHLFEEVSHIFMALTYMSLVGLAYYRYSNALVFKALSSVGKMALTNYLTQCILLSLVFYGPGLGLMYRVGTAFSIGFTFVLFAVQMVFSHLYLKRFSQGPVERLWRHLTYSDI